MMMEPPPPAVTDPRPRRNSREPVKREELLQHVRSRVLSGEWAPGALIPPRAWFTRHFGVSSLTVQRAFEILQRDGVLVANGRKGTRVSAKPPHLGRYGLVLYGTPKLESLFCRTLVHAAEQLRQQENYDIRLYFDRNDWNRNPDYWALVEAINDQNLAGLFFAASPHRLRGTPVLEQPGVPRVGVMRTGAPETQFCFPLDTGSTRLIDRALAFIARSGKRSLAVLNTSSSPESEQFLFQIWREQLARYGLTCPPELYHFFASGAPHLCTSVVRLIFSPHHTRRPEALFVGDDALLPHALRGLEAALGPERAREILVVSHGNYPLEERPEFPVHYFLVDVPELLRRGFGIIDDLRAGRAPRSGEIGIREQPAGAPESRSCNLGGTT